MDILERRIVGSVFLDVSLDLMPFLCGDPVAADRHSSIPAGSAAHRRFVRPPASHPDRNARALQRTRRELHFTHLVISALIMKGLTAPQAVENSQCFVQLF